MPGFAASWAARLFYIPSRPPQMNPTPETGAAASVLERIRALLAELLHLESSASVSAESKLREDLGIDSLGMVDMVTLLEEEFQIRFATSTDLSEIHAVNDVAALVEQRIAARQG